ncbi:MAG: MMPL family transporter [Gemmataceae bacterium]|nr:MMPL family transporter [Gemmataceae bacterium]
MFRFLGRLAVNHAGWICGAWVGVAIALTLIAPSWRAKAQDDDVRFLPADTPSVRAYALLEQAFPQDVCASRAMFVVERPGSPFSTEDLATVDKLTDSILQLKRDEPALQITGVAGRKDPLIGQRLISSDGHAALIQVSLATPYLANQTRVTVDRCEETLRAELGQSGLSLYVTGPAGVGRDLVKAGTESLDQTTIATVILVIVVLLAVYRAPLLALIPLITIGISAWVALQLLALATLIPGVRLVNISQVFAIVILFGAGTDYCLFLIARYREELERGKDNAQSVRRSVAAVGEALAASAGTVICGLAMMGFAEFAKIRSAGPVIALALAVGLVASLTLTPALLHVFGATAFWPGRVAVRVRGEKLRPTFWSKVARIVVRHPGPVWCGTFACLLPLAAIGLWVKPAFSPVGDLRPGAGSVIGLEVIKKRFSAGETGPVTVLLASPESWESTDGRAKIKRLTAALARIDNVSEVRSLSQPLGKPGGILSMFGKMDPARAHYLSTLKEGTHKYVTRVDVVLKSDPFKLESLASLDTIRHLMDEMLPENSQVRAELHGVTANTKDMAEVIDRDRTKVNLLVLAGVFLILLALVRQGWLAAYLLATVLFSYYATLGATALFAAAWTGQQFGSIEWRVPFFLFTILVAVGEDYNILMVTRAVQERKKHGAIKGIRRGIAKTGGTITACGVIMAGTFATLMLAGLGTLVQVGFALALGVLLDTMLIRPLLVPAFLLMVWRDEEPPRSADVALKIREAA